MADAATAQLTRKEKQFAAAIAGGATLAAAYAKAYSDRAGRKPAEANARQVLRREKVAAEVERLRRYPPPDNFEAIREFAIEKLLKMAESDPNSVARHRAARTLLEHSAAGLRKPPALQQPTIAPVKKVGSAELIAGLRKLYTNALGTAPPASVGGVRISPVNGLDNLMPKRDDTPLEEPEIESGATANRNEAGNPEELDGGEPPLQEVSEIRSTTTARYEWVRLPGRFGRASLVRVRVPELTNLQNI